MIYKLYKSIQKDADIIYDDSFEEFNKIYKKYDVQVLGGGTNVDNPREVYFMVVYKDQTHYDETVKQLKNDQKYSELSKTLQESRDSIEVTTLESSYQM